MIRQAINCDMCSAEKQASNYWFVAYEQGGELKLRGWESPQNSRKNVKHLCGQKCAQRLVANFMASLMSATHGSDQSQSKDSSLDPVDQSFEAELLAPSIPEKAERTDHAAARTPDRTPDRDPVRVSERIPERTDRSLLSRLSAANVPTEEESWVGPVRFKEDSWDRPNKLRIEHEPFVNSSRARISGRPQRMA